MKKKTRVRTESTSNAILRVLRDHGREGPVTYQTLWAELGADLPPGRQRIDLALKQLALEQRVMYVGERVALAPAPKPLQELQDAGTRYLRERVEQAVLQGLKVAGTVPDRATARQLYAWMERERERRGVTMRLVTGTELLDHLRGMVDRGVIRETDCGIFWKPASTASLDTKADTAFLNARTMLDQAALAAFDPPSATRTAQGAWQYATPPVFRDVPAAFRHLEDMVERSMLVRTAFGYQLPAPRTVEPAAEPLASGPGALERIKRELKRLGHSGTDTELRLRFCGVATLVASVALVPKRAVAAWRSPVGEPTDAGVVVASYSADSLEDLATQLEQTDSKH